MSQQINLFNPIFRKQKKYFSAKTMVQALGLIFAGVAAMGIYAKTQLARIDTEANVVSAQLDTARKQLALLNANQAQRKKDTALEARVRALSDEAGSLQRVTAMLGGQNELGNSQGYSDYMLAFARQINEGVWLTGFSITNGGQSLAIAGRAVRPELVPSFLSRLSTEASMKGRSFDVFEIQTPLKNDSSSAPDEGAPFVEFTVRSTASIAPSSNQEGGAQ